MFDFENEYSGYDDNSFAMEGIFGPKSVEKLLKSAKKVVQKKCKTIADCDRMLQQVQGEADKFTGNMEEMKQLAEALKVGNITKDDFKSQIKAISAQLKDTCLYLKLSDINKKSNNVTDEEIANLRAYIIGLINIIRARREEIMGNGGADDTTVTQNTMESAGYRLTEDGDYEVANEGLFTKFTKGGKAAKANLESMSEGDVVKAYAEYLVDKYGRDLCTDKEALADAASEGAEVKKIGGVLFAIGQVKGLEAYFYGFSTGKGKGYKFRSATVGSMRKTLVAPMAKAQKEAQQAEAVESIINLMVESGLADDVDSAVEAFIPAIESLTDGNNYWALFKRGNKFYNQAIGMVYKRQFEGAIKQFEKARDEYKDCIEFYKNSDDYVQDEKDRKNVSYNKVKVTGISGLFKLLGGIKTVKEYHVKDSCPKNELIEYARALISECNIGIKRCEKLIAEGTDKYDYKYEKKAAIAEAKARRKAARDYKKQAKLNWKNRNNASDSTASESFIGSMLDVAEEGYMSDYETDMLEAFMHGAGMVPVDEAFMGVIAYDDPEYDNYEY